MNCLITGASGFVGSRLAERLLAQGHTVNVTARKRRKDADSRQAFFYWDGNETPPLECMGRLDAVFHLAGEPVAQRWTAAVKRRIWDSRVEGTRKLVEAIGRLKHKPRVLVCASATGFYGSRGDEILTEHSAPGRGFLADVCFNWEKQAIEAERYGLRVVLARLGVVLGHGGALAKMLPMFRVGLGGCIGNGQQWMPWISREDLVRILERAASDDQISGPVNVCAPNPVRNVEFTQTLCEVLGRRPFLNVPLFALKLAYGDGASALSDSQRVVPERLLRADFVFQSADLRHCLERALAHQGNRMLHPEPQA